MFITTLNPKITVISEHPLLITMQNIACGDDILDVNGYDIDGVDEPQCNVYANGNSHTKVPLDDFLRPINFRITLDTDEAQCSNNGGVDNLTTTQHKTAFLWVFVHLFDRHLTHTMTHQRTPERHKNGFVQQFNDTPPGLTLLQGACHDWVAKIIKKLRTLGSRYSRKRVLSPDTLTLRIILSYIILKLPPFNQLSRPLEKGRSDGLAHFVQEPSFAEVPPIHSCNEPYAVDNGRITANFSRLFRGSVGTCLTLNLFLDKF